MFITKVKSTVFAALATMMCLVQTAGAQTSDADNTTVTAGTGDVQLFRPTHDRFNLHLALGFVGAFSDDLMDNSTGNEYENLGLQGLIGFDLVLAEPVALSFQGGFNSLFGGPKADTTLTSALVGAGVRFRFLTDTNGPLADGGTAAGNLWLDVHFDYVNHEFNDYGGYDIGVGYEFALFNNINVGPYARFMHVAIGKEESVKYAALSAGIAISIAGDTEPGDMDLDTIVDELDSCPKQPEDKDDFDDEDGCPDVDNDEDGLMDDEDKCPNTAGIAEKDGCPETDNDKDGIDNQDDLCPEDVEDIDDFQDDDGCPDPDNDGDGIDDASDKCPGEAEDKDGFMDADGCPDSDNDDDGIADEKDQCPNEKETTANAEDNDGCPDLVRLQTSQLVFTTPVAFAKNNASISDEAIPAFAEAAAVIANKGNVQVKIDVYYGTAKNEKKNEKVAADRVAAVKKALVDAGVPEGTITVVPHGTAKEGIEEKETLEILLAIQQSPTKPADVTEKKKTTASDEVSK